jgi:ABC-type multidrug transport system ATPase subunit
LTIGGLFAFMNAFWKLINASNGVISLLPELSKLNGYVDRLTDFEARAAHDEEGDYQHIELENVSVKYNGGEVLKGITLKINENERVLVIGPNGSGKTTLAYIITGFLKPCEGSVRTPDLKRVSALLAPFYFIPGTLKDNVNYEKLSEDNKRLFWKLVEQFGLANKLGEDLSALSEGEKKKCQIIMTLLKDADVYIFDEPLANIDVESKDTVMNTLEHIRGKTLISIMHGDEKFHGLFERIVKMG